MYKAFFFLIFSKSLMIYEMILKNNRLSIEIVIYGHLKFNICDESEMPYVNVAWNLYNREGHQTKIMKIFARGQKNDRKIPRKQVHCHLR